MPAATCPSGEDLKAYAWGELPLQREASLADHLETCPRCEAAVQTLERQGDPLLARLRMPVKPDPYLEEPECRQVVQRLLSRAIPNDDQVTKSSPAFPPPLACPCRFQEYDLLEKLGEGGMGTVYKARHRQLNKLVAIKILPPGLAQDPQRIARFKREMKAVGQLDHPHIVRAMDAGQAEGRHYLVMEYVEGLDLSKIIDRIGPLAAADACEIVRQVAVGLRAADERGLIHRDIKPSNLMLTSGGQVKILDLGLAVFEMERTADGETTAFGQIVGTPDYIAPEQINDAHSVDARADIYSLGCTLYKLLTGQAPFAGPRYKSTAEKMTAHLRDLVPPIRTLLPRVPQKLAGLLDRMLAKDRDLRIPTPGRLVDELAAFCVGANLSGLLDLAQTGLPQGSLRPLAGEAGRSRLPSGTAPVSPLPPGEGQGVRVAGPERSPARIPQPAANPSGAQPVVAAVNMNQDAKQSDFDPYHKWLGIPPEEQPPNHYRLLGLQLFESDTEVILGAVMRQSAHLKTYQLGPHSALTQKLLNEVSAAKVSLMDPQRKAAYDARLRKELKTRKAPARPQTLPVAKPLAGPASLPSPDAPLPSASPTISTPVAPAEPAVESGLAELFNQIDGNVALSHPKAKKPASARDAVKGRRPNARGWLVAGGAAIVAGGIFAAMLIMRMRDKEGNVVAEMQVPAGGTVEVAEKGGRAGGTAGSSGSARPSPIPNPKSEISNSRSEISNPRSGISNSKSEIPPLAVAPFDEKKAKEYQETWAKHLGVPVEVTNAVGMKLVLIPPGEFEMGSTPEEIEWASPDKWYYNRAPAEAPRHHVKITRAFYMAAYPVTQGEYEKVMGVNPSAFTEKQVDVSTFKPPLDRGQIEEREKKAKKVAGRDTSRYPVETVNWDEATEFCRTLSAAPAERTSQLAYRLPTDAEWEYACRSGTTTRWYSGDDESDLQDYAWFGQNSSGMTHPVGKKKPNAWGLYDMHGNVCQWCSDRYGGYMQSPVSDPKGPPSGDARVLRGGFWSAINCRSASRHWNLPAERSRITPGFRVVAEVAVEEQEQPTAPATPSNAGNSNAPAPAIAPFGEAKAKEHQEAWAKHLGVPVEMANSIGMKLVLIPPGEFMMGEGGDAHKVAITKAFYLGSYVVTQEQWQTVMGSNPSESKNTAPKNPVGRVTWEDCQEFLRRLGETPGAARASYNLPTEAQWEYACRAGSASRYCFGDSDAELGEYAWYRENSGHQMHPVGAKKPNAWGLFDMHGNVNEWCADWYDEGYYRASPGIDPAGPSGGERRARRGGGFDFPAGDCRSAFRYGSKPGVHFGDLGLRVSQVLPDQPGEPHKPAPRIETRESADLSKAKPAEADLHAGKIAPPSAQEQKRLIQTIDEAYKSEAAKDRTAQIALAQKLLEDGRKNDANRAEQFVMLRRSGEIARDAGAADLMLEAVDAMAQAGFDIKPLSIKARLLTQLLEQDPPAGLPQRCDLGLSCARFAEEAAAGGAADEASEVLQAAHDSLAKARKGVQQALQRARTASARARNPADKAAREKEVQQTQEQLGAADSALAAVAESSKGLRQLQRDGEALHAAREQLKTTPDDAEASLTVGRWQCFNEGDWDSGLKLLAQGSDGALKSLAAEELTAKPAKAEDKAARGDAWWDAAGKAAGRDKSGMRGRAAYWYQEAVGELSPGLAKLKLEKRLAQMAEDKSPQPAGSAKIRPPLAVAPFDEKTAVLHQKRWGKYLRAPVVQTNSIGMKLVLIPPGEFMMGSPKELIQEELNTPNIPNWDKERLSNEGPSHRVRITHPFYFGLYEVTQEEYQRVMGWNHSEYSASGRERDKVAGLDTTRFPVENLEWRDAAEFCQKLSELPEEKAAGRSYHLPSEAQWEYACRAGTTGRYSFSPNGSDIPKKLDEDALADYGWFSGNSGGMVHPVGQKKPNAWGLYDMHGNVWEWCQDFRDATGASYYAGSPVDDPGGPGGGQHDINRGGSFTGPARLCRSANRGHNGPGWGCEHGMRACMVLTGK